MKTTEEIQILECRTCKHKPIFVPLPAAEFPISFVSLCGCNYGSLHHGIHSTMRVNADIIKNNSVIRKASLTAAIKKWNRRVATYIKSKQTRYDPDYVTCRYCKRDGLLRGRRPYISRWKPSSKFLLYEKVEQPPSPAGSSNWPTFQTHKFKIHSCLSRKNIVSEKIITD